MAVEYFKSNNSGVTVVDSEWDVEVFKKQLVDLLSEEYTVAEAQDMVDKGKIEFNSVLHGLGKITYDNDVVDNFSIDEDGDVNFI